MVSGALKHSFLEFKQELSPIHKKLESVGSKDGSEWFKSC